MFRTLDRHVLFEWLTIFALVMGATFGLLLLFDVFDKLPDLQGYAASRWEILKYFAVRAPWFLSFVLPIAVLISLLYVLGLMHRNNEITAMRAAGIGLLRITRWIWVGTVIIALLLFYLNSSLIPWSVEQSRLIMTNLEVKHEVRQGSDASDVAIVHDLAYDNISQFRRWHIGRFSRYDHTAHDVQVSLLDPQGGETIRILARDGYWDDLRRQWVLRRGLEIYNPVSSDTVRPVTFDEKVFPQFKEDPEWMLVLLKKAKDLSIFELGRIIDSPDTVNHPQRAAFAVRYHTLLAGTFSCLIAAGLAVPFAVSGVRVNPAVGVSKSLGLFFLYYLLATIGRLMGEQHVIEPWLAAWVPNVFMAGLAVWFMFRAR